MKVLLLYQVEQSIKHQNSDFAFCSNEIVETHI